MGPYLECHYVPAGGGVIGGAKNVQVRYDTRNKNNKHRHSNNYFLKHMFYFYLEYLNDRLCTRLIKNNNWQSVILIKGGCAKNSLRTTCIIPSRTLAMRKHRDH